MARLALGEHPTHGHCCSPTRSRADPGVTGPKLLQGHQPAAKRIVDQRAEPVGSDEPADVHEGPCRRSDRDGPAPGEVGQQQRGAPVVHDAVVAQAHTRWRRDVDVSRLAEGQTPQPAGAAVGGNGAAGQQAGGEDRLLPCGRRSPDGEHAPSDRAPSTGAHPPDDGPIAQAGQAPGLAPGDESVLALGQTGGDLVRVHGPIFPPG